MKVLLLLCMFYSCVVFAQNRRSIYCVDRDGRLNSKSGSCVRIVDHPAAKGGLYQIQEFYENRQLRMKGQASSLDPNPVYEGAVISYYPDGRRKSVQYFKQGVSCDSAYYFYPDGRLEKTLMECAKSDNGISCIKEPRLLTYIDSLGEMCVCGGNGYLKLVDAMNKIVQEGTYKEGYKDGLWLVSNKRGQARLMYQKGSFIGGTAVWKDGSTHQVKTLNATVGYVGGMKVFKKYLQSALRKSNTKGLGRLSVSYLIDDDGLIKDIKCEPIMDSVDMMAITEGMRCSPAIVSGLPVASKHEMTLMVAE